MKEAEKAAAGLLYDANYDVDLLKQRDDAKLKLFTFNHTPFTEKEKERKSSPASSASMEKTTSLRVLSTVIMAITLKSVKIFTLM